MRFLSKGLLGRITVINPGILGRITRGELPQTVSKV
jgi:hypothetical protein